MSLEDHCDQHETDEEYRCDLCTPSNLPDEDIRCCAICKNTNKKCTRRGVVFNSIITRSHPRGMPYCRQHYEGLTRDGTKVEPGCKDLDYKIVLPQWVQKTLAKPVSKIIQNIQQRMDALLNQSKKEDYIISTYESLQYSFNQVKLETNGRKQYSSNCVSSSCQDIGHEERKKRLVAVSNTMKKVLENYYKKYVDAHERKAVINIREKLEKQRKYRESNPIFSEQDEREWDKYWDEVRRFHRLKNLKRDWSLFSGSNSLDQSSPRVESF
jgi:hypothetical protein